MPRRALVAMTFAFSALAVLVGCHRSKSYEANVEVTRSHVLRKDEKGVPLMADFEFTYSECPGTQVEVIRGDAKFAACTSKYNVGDKVKISILHHWSDEGHYKWTVKKVGDCERVVDPADEASFAMVRECDDLNVNGQKSGFECKYTPEKKLIDKCPWFRRY